MPEISQVPESEGDRNTVRTVEHAHVHVISENERESATRKAEQVTQICSEDAQPNSYLNCLRDRIEAQAQGPTQSDNTLRGKTIVVPEGWEKDFEAEPLKSVQLEELEKTRTPEEVRKLKMCLWRFKHIISDGTLDFRNSPNTCHNTTCDITTMKLEQTFPQLNTFHR